ncbi:MAG: TatD family hydrolase [Deltaproteobacteria bacterium]|jgi:TatD DNase family protein|nr:TatD family hydrolase [Deltaproteobacteria bacterium]
MEIFDSHTHLFLDDFDPDREEVARRAAAAGVTRLVNVGLDLETSRTALGLARRTVGWYAAAGWHPHDAARMTPEDPGRLAELAGDPLVVAFGEIGLDFYRDSSPRDVQLKAFRSLLEAAAGTGKPVVIHTREAAGETLALLAEFRDSLAGILIHCFTGGPAEAEGYLGLGCRLSLPGVLTYKNAAPMREAVRIIPRDRILVETDAPYLAPVPRRGRRNEPAYLVHLLEELGGLLGVSAGEAAELTTANALGFFGIGGEAGCPGGSGGPGSAPGRDGTGDGPPGPGAAGAGGRGAPG